MAFKDLVHGVKFHVQKKEAYSLEDVYAIEEQLRNKIVSEIGNTIEEQLSGLQTEVQTHKEAFEAEKAKAEETSKEFEDFKAKASEWENKVNEFNAEQSKKTAQELFKGIVANGAELDVHAQLGEKIKEIEFEESETLEQRQAKIKPLVQELIQTKPYLAPAQVKDGDNKNIITKKEGGAEGKELSGAAKIAAENGFTPSGNVIRKAE